MNMKVTLITIVGGALGTFPKRGDRAFEQLEIEGKIEAIQTTALVGSARILRKVLETRGNLLSLRLQWKSIV